MTPAGPTERVLWSVVIVLVVGYLAGAWLNRRRNKTIGRWLQTSLGTLGGQPAWKWAGSMNSGAQITISGANRPFRQLKITYLMLTREFVPLLLFELLRGKRDVLAIRAELRNDPADEIEVVPIHGKLRQTLDKHAGDQPWTWEECPEGLGLATHGAGDPRLTARIRRFLGRYGAYVQRFSLRKRQPNLILFVCLDGLEKAPAADFLRALRETVGT